MYAIDKNTPPNGDFNTPGHFDTGTGFNSVNVQSASYSTFQKPNASASVTHYTDEFLGGSHDFKFGVQVAPKNSIVSSSPLMGGRFFMDLNGAPYYVLTREPNANAGSVTTAGVFVQDNWTATNRITLNLGVRYDRTSASVPGTSARDVQFEKTSATYPGIDDLIGWNDVAARVGFTAKLDSPRARPSARRATGGTSAGSTPTCSRRSRPATRSRPRCATTPRRDCTTSRSS